MYFFDTPPHTRVSSAIVTLHTDPVLPEIEVVNAERAWKIRCTNPLPMRSLASLSESIDRIQIEDRNVTGASLEFGRFKVQLFVGEEMTDRFDCDFCDIEAVLKNT